MFFKYFYILQCFGQKYVGISGHQELVRNWYPPFYNIKQLDLDIKVSYNLKAGNTRNWQANWVMLLEKAYAKVHGGYANIAAGLTREA